MSMEQFEAFLSVGQLKELQQLKYDIRAVAVGMAGKSARSVLSSLDGRIAVIRRGISTEQEIAEAHMESQYGQSVGPLSDAGLSALGIVPDQGKKEGNGE